MRSLNATHTHTHACTHSHFACMDWVSFIFSFRVFFFFFFIPSTELFRHPHLRALRVSLAMLVQCSTSLSPINMISFQLRVVRYGRWAVVCLILVFRNDCAYNLTSSIRQAVASMESREISTKLDYFKQILCFSTNTSQGFRTNAGHFVSSEKSERKNDNKKA